MIEPLARRWQRFWFQPASPIGLLAVRTIVIGNVLWLLASRPDLPDVLTWPAEFWGHASGPLKLRFLVFDLPFAVEQALFGLLHVALATALLGILPAASTLVAALLLYHFAPLEDILIYGLGPTFRGLTLPMLALFVLSFAPAPRLSAAPAPGFGWPLKLIQLLFSLGYFFPGYSKLVAAGLSWGTAAHIRETVLIFATIGPVSPPWAEVVAWNPVLCWAIALGTIPIELLFPLAVVSRKAARVVVPLMFLGHLAIERVYGIYFYNLPMLLVYVDWEWIVRRLGGRPGTRGIQADR